MTGGLVEEEVAGHTEENVAAVEVALEKGFEHPALGCRHTAFLILEVLRLTEAVVEPGVYVLQAGSFSTNTDADRRRAELALQGIESHIQRVTVNDREYHRVYVGPTDDLDELNLLRSRLRAAKIDVLRIRLSD